MTYDLAVAGQWRIVVYDEVYDDDDDGDDVTVSQMKYYVGQRDKAHLWKCQPNNWLPRRVGIPIIIFIFIWNVQISVLIIFCQLRHSLYFPAVSFKSTINFTASQLLMIFV